MIETGVLFNEIHSYRDLNLILSRVEVAPAAPKTNYVDIPGADGSIDLSEALGEVKFYDRTIKLTFTMNPGGDLSEAAWEAKKTQVSNCLNGLPCKITLDKDPGYYWKGRATVDEYQSTKRLRQFVVSVAVKPYKLKQEVTVVSTAISSAGKAVTLKNSRRPVCPTVSCTDDNTQVVFGGNTVTFGQGEHKDLGIRLKEGDNVVTVSGSGTVTFTYQEADL